MTNIRTAAQAVLDLKNDDYPSDGGEWSDKAINAYEALRQALAAPDHIDALIAEAVAKEREACAQICHSFDEEWGSDVFLRIADAIRARGQK